VIRTLSSVANGSISQHWTNAVRIELVNNVMALTKLLAAAGFLPPSSSSNDFSSTFSSIDQSTNASKAILFLKGKFLILKIESIEVYIFLYIIFKFRNLSVKSIN
jgi:hypothetical protein